MKKALMGGLLLAGGLLAANADADTSWYRAREPWERPQEKVEWTAQAALRGDDVRWGMTRSDAAVLEGSAVALSKMHLGGSALIAYDTGSGHLRRFELAGGYVGEPVKDVVCSATLASVNYFTSPLDNTWEIRLEVAGKDISPKEGIRQGLKPSFMAVSDVDEGRGQYFRLGVSQARLLSSSETYSLATHLSGSFGYNNHLYRTASGGSDLTVAASLVFQAGNFIMGSSLTLEEAANHDSFDDHRFFSVWTKIAFGKGHE